MYLLKLAPGPMYSFFGGLIEPTYREGSYSVSELHPGGWHHILRVCCTFGSLFQHSTRSLLLGGAIY